MPRALQHEDYVAAATLKNLDFIGELYDKRQLRRLSSEFDYYVHGSIPDYAVDSTNWRCRLTGRIMNKRIAVVKRSAYGSRYQREFWETHNKYKNLAQRLGITFLYDPAIEFFPVTTKIPCRWLSREGHLVLASYHDLGYNIISADLRGQLGLAAELVEVSYGF